MCDYYAENGFGVLKDISVSMFGQDVATVAGPIKLPRARMVDYATGLFRPLDASGNPFSFRRVESMTTVQDPADSIELQAVWTLDFFTNDGKPDVAMVCHELGHGVGFRDLYQQTGYREDLAYLGDWAIMCNHWNKSHHCAYHKQQAGLPMTG